MNRKLSIYFLFLILSIFYFGSYIPIETIFNKRIYNFSKECKIINNNHWFVSIVNFAIVGKNVQMECNFGNIKSQLLIDNVFLQNNKIFFNGGEIRVKNLKDKFDFDLIKKISINKIELKNLKIFLEKEKDDGKISLQVKIMNFKKEKDLFFLNYSGFYKDFFVKSNVIYNFNNSFFEKIYFIIPMLKFFYSKKDFRANADLTIDWDFFFKEKLNSILIKGEVKNNQDFIGIMESQSNLNNPINITGNISEEKISFNLKGEVLSFLNSSNKEKKEFDINELEFKNLNEEDLKSNQGIIASLSYIKSFLKEKDITIDIDIENLNFSSDLNFKEFKLNISTLNNIFSFNLYSILNNIPFQIIKNKIENINNYNILKKGILLKNDYLNDFLNDSFIFDFLFNLDKEFNIEFSIFGLKNDEKINIKSKYFFNSNVVERSFHFNELNFDKYKTLKKKIDQKIMPEIDFFYNDEKKFFSKIINNQDIKNITKDYIKLENCIFNEEKIKNFNYYNYKDQISCDKLFSVETDFLKINELIFEADEKILNIKIEIEKIDYEKFKYFIRDYFEKDKKIPNFTSINGELNFKINELIFDKLKFEDLEFNGKFLDGKLLTNQEKLNIFFINKKKILYNMLYDLRMIPYLEVAFSSDLIDFCSINFDILKFKNENASYVTFDILTNKNQPISLNEKICKAKIQGRVKLNQINL